MPEITWKVLRSFWEITYLYMSCISLAPSFSFIPVPCLATIKSVYSFCSFVGLSHMQTGGWHWHSSQCNDVIAHVDGAKTVDDTPVYRNRYQLTRWTHPSCNSLHRPLLDDPAPNCSYVCVYRCHIVQWNMEQRMCVCHWMRASPSWQWVQELMWHYLTPDLGEAQGHGYVGHCAHQMEGMVRKMTKLYLFLLYPLVLCWWCVYSVLEGVRVICVWRCVCKHIIILTSSIWWWQHLCWHLHCVMPMLWCVG